MSIDKNRCDLLASFLQNERFRTESNYARSQTDTRNVAKPMSWHANV